MGRTIERVIVCGIEVTGGTDTVLRALAECEGFVPTVEICRKIPSRPDHNGILSKLNALWRRNGSELIIRKEPRPTITSGNDQRHRMVLWKATEKLRAHYGISDSSETSAESPATQEGTS